MRIGIDLGGTKIEVIALGDDGKTLFRQRRATPTGDYDATLRVIAELVVRAEQKAGQRGSIGVGIPGSESPRNGLIRNANSTCLIGRPLRGDLQQRLGREVRIANDANCFALSEARDGAGAGAAVMFGIILGTGVGGGIVVDGRILEGRNRIGGEWGHNPLPWPERTPGPACYCGRSACNESYLSGPALARSHFELHGRKLDPSEIARRADAGDGACGATLALYSERLARALAEVVNLLDPDVIVLGGGLSQIRRLYADLPALVAPHVFSDTFDTPIVPPMHGDSSGVRGAAWLWPTR
jgi:fructokinase